MGSETFAKGLEGVIAAESVICKIDGAGGKLYYRGYSIEDLAGHCSYEEVTYLLLYDHLPTLTELNEFTQKMRSSRSLSQPILDMVRAFPPTAHPMELLQSAVSYLSGYVTHRIAHSATCNCRDTLHQVAQLATVLAACARFRGGKEYIPPRTDLSHGANFLYMLRGEPVDPLEGEIMDTCLVLHAEHGFNASTFTARVVASTLSTCYSSISSAIGSLYGSLHGGANERVVDMVDSVGDKGSVTQWVENAFNTKQKIMGMGHRVYKVKDPRARIMEGLLLRLSEYKKNFQYYELLKEIEKTVSLRMEQDGKLIYPNVDFFSGAVYLLLGIPPLFFTPIFAMSRVAGWLAHILEQRADNRIYRPKSLYVGPEPRQFTPIDKRG